MEIILYSTGCPKCKVLKQKMQEKNIAYSEVNDTQVMLEMGITQVPVLSVAGKLLTFTDANKWVNAM